MSVCNYCGASAGWFKSAHPECIERAAQENAAHDRLREQWANVLAAEIGSPTFDLTSGMETMGKPLGVDVAREVAADVFSDTINRIIQKREQPGMDVLGRYADFAAAFGIGSINASNRAWHRFVMLIILAELDIGKFPDRVEDPGLGFMYERGERIAWVCGAMYYEDQVRHASSPFYGGVSMRVMPGLYVHSGSRLTQGSTVEGLVAVADGNLVVTDRALWFQGPHGISRTYISHIAAFECLEDGFGFCEIGGRNKAFMSENGEGWFLHDLVTRLAQLERERI